jgi:nucleotide-binding universal stress UspA family protein
MVVGIDLSDTASAAATWACRHFAPAADVTLVHAIDLPTRPRFARDLIPSPEETEAERREYARRRLGIVGRMIGRDVRSEIRVGRPHEVIAKLVHEIGADLIVVGPHDDRHPAGFLGTTAHRIVRTSPVPVLVASSPPATQPRKLLVPVDDASITPTLLDWTRDLAEAFDAEVKLLHVWSNAVYSHVASMSLVTAPSEAAARVEISKELRDAANHWLDELAHTGLTSRRVTSAVSYGNPGSVTLEVAAAMQADLIVLGRHGSGLVGPALFGSTARTVLHGATCPVLVITEAPGVRTQAAGSPTRS